MQRNASNAEDYSITALNDLIESIKKATFLSEEEICKRMNYNEGYISQVRTRNKVSGKFIESLKREFANSLQNANSVREISEPSIDHESRRTLERTLENLSEDKIRSTAIIERLVTMLEKQISSGLLSKSHQEAPPGPENNVVSPGFARVIPAGKGEKEKPKGKH
jgi:uncharacterized protein YnzC (UPF0291/DUF896 family)